jgi:SHS family sialic acid transporter-like MFS transporter
MGGNGQGMGRSRWMALTAALLGWMFDGLEMGLFPLVARPALGELLHNAKDDKIGLWFGVATAGFLVGAATGGVLFGWLGDRLGRVRALTLSVFTYAVFSGLCGFATAAWQIAVLRFVSALGMGGEWSLGVALVMEVWPNRSRALLAGLIGAAANFGYMFIALLGLGLGRIIGPLGDGLRSAGLPEEWVASLVGHSGWRILMILGATPAILTFFIRLFVPESSRWEKERERGHTSGWAARDLVGVLAGAAACVGLIWLWAVEVAWPLRIVGTLAALACVTVCYLYPVVRYLQRSEVPERGAGFQPAGQSGGQVGNLPHESAEVWRPTVLRMLLGACLSGVALLATWASIQWAPVWADQLSEQAAHRRVASLGMAGGGSFAWVGPQADPAAFAKDPEPKAYTQVWSAFGAILGTILAAFLGDWIGRRLSYSLLCATALGSTLLFFQTNDHVGPYFLATAFLAGACTASFYGWLPLYLPELFRTRVRATGQGFSFNFGRILAAVGTLQTGVLAAVGYPLACSVMSLIYVVGLMVIWLAPETRGRPLPE